MRLIKLLPVVIFCLLSVSCSFIKAGYNNAPKLTIWWLDDYLDLTQAQNSVLEPALITLHHWHRKHQLPQTITFLNTLQTAFASNELTPNTVCDQIQSIKSSVYRLQTEAIPIIIEIAPLLTDQQLAYFQQKLDKRAKKWKSEWWQETGDDQLKARLDKAEDFAEDVYGDLSEAQVALIKQKLIQMNIDPAISFKEITRRNNDAFSIVSELQKQKSKLNDSNSEQISERTVEIEAVEIKTVETKTKVVQAGFDRIQKSPDLVFQHYANNLTKQTCETIASLHATTSATQKLHAKNWLNDYVVQLSALQIE